MTPVLQRGTVTRFNKERGFGFIDGNVFFHVKSFMCAPITTVDDIFYYALQETDRGIAAVRLDRAPESPYVVVNAGNCATSTGYRHYVKPEDRVCVYRFNSGYRPQRGDVALVRRGMLVYVCNWGHGQDERPYWAAAGDTRTAVPCDDAPSETAVRWCVRQYRSESYWPD